MAFFKETNRSIKILLIGVNSVVFLFTVPIVVGLLKLRGSDGVFDQAFYRSAGGDMALMLFIISLPFMLFLVFLGIRFRHFIINKPKLVIGVFVFNFVVYLGSFVLDFENIGIMSYIVVVLQIYILINILRLAKEQGGVQPRIAE